MHQYAIAHRTAQQLVDRHSVCLANYVGKGYFKGVDGRVVIDGPHGDHCAEIARVDCGRIVRKIEAQQRQAGRIFA